MSYDVKRDWITEAGYRAVVIFCNGSHHCGYVGIPEGHWLHGKTYSEEIEIPDGYFDGVQIGKRGLVDIFCQAMSGKSETCRVGFLFDVHGGITYSDEQGKYKYPVESPGLWWFGYDCAHCDDRTRYSPGIFRDEAYCVAECESLAKQLKAHQQGLSAPAPQTKEEK